MKNSKLKDQIIKCRDCVQDFVWTTGEQEFYLKKGLRSPARCPICRAAFDAAKKDKFRGKVRNQAM